MSANYKDTLLLPKTDFPMKADLVRREPERLAKWEADGVYQRILDARIGAPLFVLHDGPPFANGDVHMGTALNKVLKDFIVKSRSMLGFRAPFVPGWDCHGLPIEFKVVKEQRGLAPAEIRRRAEEFARKYIDIQRGQFKRLGVFGSWGDPYLTLAPGYEADIIRAFGKLVEKDLVYRAKKPVLWSWGAQTALAEAEVEYSQRTDPAIYVKFAIADGKGALAGASFVIWTTTPWTLPANVAIAVHPKAKYICADFRNEKTGKTEKLIVAAECRKAFEKDAGYSLIGENLEPARASVWVQSPPTGMTRTLERTDNPTVNFCFEHVALDVETLLSLEAQHPFLSRKSKVIAADFVTLDTGTGQVHIAPGHGKDDYIAGQANGLPVLSPVDDLGRFVQLEPEYGQLPEAWIRKEVAPKISQAPDSGNAAVIEELKIRGSLLAEKWEPHDYPHCWRSKTPIVFRAVEQFFIRIGDPQDPQAPRFKALVEIDNHVQWLPASAKTRIKGTVMTRPDWCISRQRTWGVPLPVFYLTGTHEPILNARWIHKIADLIEKRGTNVWFELGEAELLKEAGIGEDEIGSVFSLQGPKYPLTLEILNRLGHGELAKQAAAGDEKMLARIKMSYAEVVQMFNRRNDTLDVWIDSGVSHQAVTSRHPELKACGGVADVYLEATDQHRGWFQSSLMTSVALTGHAPYKTVITHGFVVDKDTKKKVSKSDQGTYKKPMEAEYFVGKYGADIVRLWAASVQFTDDVPFSEDGFARTSEAYRSFRNVLRILLANLHDASGTAGPAVGVGQASPPVQGDTGRRDARPTPTGGDACPTTVDRWILSKLQVVIAACRAGYEAYDFRKVFETLNQFCTVELSALYVDITKDRLYCDAADSPRRRATQAVMRACFEALAKLLAPILAFTADEAWEFAGHATSVHVEAFPQADPALRDEKAEQEIEEWLKLRGVVMQQAIEPARQAKTLAKSLEGSVTLAVPESRQADLEAKRAELEEFFIISELKLAPGAEPAAKVIRSGQPQCPRCWRHQPLTARGVCARCDDALAKLATA